MATASALGSSQDPSFPLKFRRAEPERYGAFLGDERMQVRALSSAKIPAEAQEVPRAIAVPPLMVAIGRALGEKTNRELTWLARNRHLYANRWIALDGDTLLAIGNSAREVYAAIAGYGGIPLVIQVEPPEGANFAGW